MTWLKRNTLSNRLLFCFMTDLYVATENDDARQYECNGRVENGVKNSGPAFAEICRADRQARLRSVRN